MTAPSFDLAVLSADRTIEAVVRALLDRHQALGTRAITAQLVTHPERDPGCRVTAHEILQPYVGRATHALVVFDHEGSGAGGQGRTAVEAQVESLLSANGWSGCGAAVAIDPELEAWVWSDSPHVATALGWSQSTTALRAWMDARGYGPPAPAKPGRPKEALRAVLREVRKPFSAAIHQELAKRVGLSRCTDPALRKLLSVLRGWFP